MSDPLLDSWQINDRINRYLLNAIPSSILDTAGPTKGRTIAQTFGHIHNVRLMWLTAAGATMPASVKKLDLDAVLTAPALSKALTASGDAMSDLIAASIAAGGKVKGFKPHVHAFVAYLVSHESHHRGQVMIVAKSSGTKIDKKVAFGLWEWGVR